MTTSSFDALILNELNHLKPVAIQLTRDKVLAEDLFQETIYKALRYQKHYQDGTNMSAWLYTIMRNTFINDYRREVRARVIFKCPSTGSVQSGLTEESGESRIIEKEVMQVIHQLPIIFRSAFLLYFEGYKYNEIASKLDQPVGTIKSRIHFARKLLRKIISRN